MEIPFYLSFKEFEKNYQTDLSKWFEDYPDSDEVDFLKELVGQYYYYLDYDFTEDQLTADVVITLPNCIFPYHEKSECRFIAAYENGKRKKVFWDENQNVLEWKKITMMEYTQHILDKIHTYFKDTKTVFPENETLNHYMNNREIITYDEFFGYRVDYELHQKTLPFLRAYMPLHGEKVNESRFMNFNFAIVRIAKFIDQRLKTLKAFEWSFYQRVKSQAKLPLDRGVRSETQSISTPSKIKVNGSLQALGFILTELMDKGYIEPQRKNGKLNTQGTAKMILDHFEFTKEEFQPVVESVRQSLFTQNKFSNDKQDLFKIPSCKQLEK
ncbi:hypothetical protein FE904_19575 [Chryseobacterium indologenes]|uniref:hypothetical protein n=1 Tax=Chryseobacterium indologenes TaxID=253 RepID=UPI0011092F1A|nr:hypothetical protein [Chryseobacterium indologenes]TLX23951.1 hypothetical protein FE904_19575 [Chryseobacterium indologenes]